MASAAAKLRAKRRTQKGGRPRRTDVERYPSGQIKYSEPVEDVKEVALEARKRVFGIDVEHLTKKENKKPPHASKRDIATLSGYTLGRIFLDGKINEAQLEAGNEYASQMSRYYSLTGIPFPSARAQDMNRVRGFDGEQSEDRATRARKQSNLVMKLEGILLRCQDGPQVKTTVRNTCLLDIEVMRGMNDAQMDMLRRGLSALHFELELQKTRKSATNETHASNHVRNHPFQEI